MDAIPATTDTARQAAGHFRIEGTAGDVARYGTGHIHDTFAVTVAAGTRARRFILQRLNTAIFRDVQALMTNIERVTTHVRAKLAATPGADARRGTLSLVLTHAGSLFHRTQEGDCWRCYAFIEGARTFDVLTNPRQAYEAGRAFGRFQSLLADLPPPPLAEVLPFFHNTPRRLRALEEAVAADPRNRAASCRAEIEFCRARTALAGMVVRDLESGSLPVRVTHNDTKINNVMFDDYTGKSVAVIDLDTVMPGSLLYDFGDLMRTCSGRFAENERDLSRVVADMEYLAQLTDGYLGAVRDVISRREAELLPRSGQLVALTMGIRFLTDYLRGDTYYRTHRDGENLDRSRTQFALVSSLERNEDAIAGRVRPHLP